MKKFITLCLVAFTFAQASAQVSKEEVPGLIEKKNYVFIPTRVTPTLIDDRTDLIGYLYFLSVKPDTINTYLPSFGIVGPGKMIVRNRPHNPEFQSLEFDYKTEKAKNGSWNISIVFNDTEGAENVRMLLAINKKGFGTLTVYTSSRSTRTYYGYLKAKDQPSLAE